MTAPILITGATGNVGTEIIKRLQAQGLPIRAAVTDVAEAKEKLGEGLELTPFSFTDPSTYTAAFGGVERLFLMRPPQISNVKLDMFPAIDAAKAAGVKQIVFLSLQGVERNPVVPHYKLEAYLVKSGIAYTFLRAGFFMQNLSTTHREDIRNGEVFIPAGGGKTSFIDVRDIAAAAAKALSEEGHEGKAYELTGAEALDYTQVADILSETLGKPIRYTHPPAVTFFRRMLERGQPLAYVSVITALYTVARFGLAGKVTNDTEKLLGRPPLSFRQYAQDYKAAWQ